MKELTEEELDIIEKIREHRELTTDSKRFIALITDIAVHNKALKTALCAAIQEDAVYIIGNSEDKQLALYQLQKRLEEYGFHGQYIESAILILNRALGQSECADKVSKKVDIEITGNCNVDTDIHDELESIVSEYARNSLYSGSKALRTACEDMNWTFKVNATPTDMFCMDMIRYLFYLASYNKKNNQKVTEYINALFSYDLSLEIIEKSINKYIVEGRYDGLKFEERIPETFEICKAYDEKNAILYNGFSVEMIARFNFIGEEFIKNGMIDGEADYKRKCYIDKLRYYLFN